MKMTFSWIIYSCLIFGSGILCDRKIVRQSGLTCSSHGNTENRFYCSNGRCVDWPLVCDGEEDCSDGTDETNPLCDMYNHETYRTMDCGRLNITNQAMAAEYNETILDFTPWTVFVIRLNTTNPKDFIIVCMGSFISPNIVISAARCFPQKVMLSKQTPIYDDEYKIAVPPIKSIDDENTRLMEIERIYLHKDYNESVLRFNDIAVIVLANKNMSFSYGIEPVCMDWNNKYPLFYEEQKKVFLAALRYHTRDPGRHSHYDGSFLHTDDCTCQKKNDNICADLVVYNMFCNKYPAGLRINGLILGASISSLHSNSYFLTGIASSRIRIINENKVLDFVSMKHYVPWIRGILNMHHTINSCVLPIVEGVVYTYEDTNEIIPYETLINHNLTVIENCALGYHKAYPYRSKVCQEKGKWSSNFDKLCFKMCPPLLSDSLDIECSYNNNYANCSNLSIPNTIAIPSCKLPYTLPNGQKEVPPELLCQSNGTWDKQLYSCILSNSCLLPNIEGVVYSYEGSNTILPYGTLIDYNKSIIENCKVGYYKAYRNRVRVCRRNGKWKMVSDRLCLKMCPPLLSDSLDIECSYDGKYANCSNLSIPDTIASPSCKPNYTLPNGQKEIPLELNCQANGTWNNQLYRCDPAISCILPTVEGVIYTYENSNESLSHGALINHHQIVIESCEPGYYKAYPKSFRVCQGNEKWEMISDKLCLKKCPPLLSDSLDIECSYNGKYANCSNLSIPETKATPSCKPTYALPNGQKETPLELHCQVNGTWNNQLYICYPDCGKEYIETQVLIENGKIAPVGTAPWNVGIYRLSKNNSYYGMICGGSIISPKLVVTAAHCFWKKGMPSRKISINDGRYKVAIGKYYRNFTNIDNEFTKIMDVEIVYVNELYNGFSTFHSDDIAVVVLQNKTSFSNGVLPICIDWKGNYNVSNGNEGKIVGWGNTEKGFSSPILLEAYLPYIDHNSCRIMYTNGFEAYVNYDKFCAGSVSDIRSSTLKNRSSIPSLQPIGLPMLYLLPNNSRKLINLVSGQRVNGGDSGAGLCFLHSNSYYLTGIVSSKDPYTNYSIAIFTEVKYHITWIRELFIKYN